MTSGRINPLKSEYWSIAKIRTAYLKLYARVESKDFIWCYTVPNEYILFDHETKVQWYLDVPSDSIMYFVNDVVWNRIIGEKTRPPEEILTSFRREADERFARDPIRRHRLVAELIEQFWTPNGREWQDLLSSEPTQSKWVSALVPYPIAKKWLRLEVPMAMRGKRP